MRAKHDISLNNSIIKDKNESIKIFLTPPTATLVVAAGVFSLALLLLLLLFQECMEASCLVLVL